LGLDDSAVYSAALCLKIDRMTFVGALKKIPFGERSRTLIPHLSLLLHKNDEFLWNEGLIENILLSNI
jgi:hypothetical protein